MTEVSESRKDQRRVADFYCGKSILITGAAGFVGVVLLETLLRCCPGIKTVYILLRSKKGVQPEARKDSIVKRKVFRKLKDEHPSFLDKIHVLPGDTSLPQLGLCDSDLQKIIEEVSIVFHVAATINFLKSLRYTLTQNVLGTNHVLEICKKLNCLDALVYTSTLYANSNRRTRIKETVYRLPFRAQVFIDEIKNGNDESIEKLMEECQPSWPNHYTISKCVAENLLQDLASDLPVAIIRPSIVFSSWKGAMPGYLEDGSGMTTLSLGVGKGFIKVINASPESTMDLIPVDIVANAHIIAATCVGTDRSSSPLVVNCTTYGKLNSTLKDYSEVMLDMLSKYPVPKSFQMTTSIKLKDSDFSYWLSTLYEHYLPAVVMDAVLSVTGRKPKLVRLYKFLDKAMKVSTFFLMNKWEYDTENFTYLERQLSQVDKEDLSVNLDGLTIKEHAKTIPFGAPFYEWDTDKKTISERQRVLKQRYALTNLIKAVTFIILCTLFYLIVSSTVGRMYTVQ